MADTERRLFSLSGIFPLLLLICCVNISQSNGHGQGPEYLSNGGLSSEYAVEVRSVRSPDHHHLRTRREAVDGTSSTNDTATNDPATSSTTNGSAVPDAAANGSGNDTLPDTSNPTGSSDGTGTNNTASDGDSTTPGTAAPSSTPSTPTTTPPPTTTNPFKDANIIHDDHEYYTSSASNEKFDSYFVELSTAKKHKTLSNSHRVAATIPLKFKFPFYGHLLSSITVATGGFVYMSPFLHQWLTATQYIAPLMANFDPSLSVDSHIYYLSEETTFMVEWSQLILRDQTYHGNFTFQTVLYENGSISFAYKNIPVGLDKVSNAFHPVKVGLSDAFYNDSYNRRDKKFLRTIYEYHQVTVKQSYVRTGAVVFIHPLPTCNTLNDCDSCTRHVNVSFDCQWCNSIGRCSNGFDWYRQHWDRSNCKQKSLSKTAQCINLKPPSRPIVNPIIPLGPKKCRGGECGKGSDTPVAVIVVVVILVLMLVSGVAGWTYYAYTHPTSKSGMWLMEHRPSQIKAKIKFWKENTSNGGAKYRAEAEA